MKIIIDTNIIKNLNIKLQENLILEKNDIETESTRQKREIKNENFGIILIIICNLTRSLNSLLIKYAQKKYNDIYHTIPFLFYRAIFLLFLSQIITTIKGEHILYPNEIKERFYFFLRTNLNFFGVQFNISAIWYLRVATVQIIGTLNPLLTTILSIIILKERFYLRYAVGIVTCCVGSLFIVLNERKGKNDASSEKLIEEEKKINEEEKSYGGFSIGTLFGLFFAFVDIFFISIVDVANKVLANNRVPIHTQVFYVAMNTIGYSLIYLLFTQQWYICAGYAVLIFFQSCLFYVGNFFFNAGLKYIDLAKSAPLTYSRVAFVLIFGYILLGENIYFTDIIGTCLILGYMFYNLFYPIIPEKK
jgi:drug/metabolite transporter (DMT)-like permease